jgi:hypothetical protein
VQEAREPDLAEDKRFVPEEHVTIKESQDAVQSIGQGVTFSPSVVSQDVRRINQQSNILNSLEGPELTHVVNRVATLKPVKGSNKLQRRINAIDQAIDTERIAQQRVEEARLNIEASYQEPSVKDEAAYQEPSVNIEASSQQPSVKDEEAHHETEGAAEDSHDEFEHI